MSRSIARRTPQHRIHRVVVVVPAHDERDRIDATLDSICEARARLGRQMSSQLVVVADHCSDDTSAIARRFVRRTRSTRDDKVIEVNYRRVGAARRAGTAAGLRGARDDRGVWIASTDADTIVPSDWLVAQIDFARAGATSVAGVVRLRADDGGDHVTRARFVDRYRLASNGTHDHVHGANLGIRGDAYRRAGGWQAMTTGEDHDLWRRLQVAGGAVATTSVSVETSARRDGRAPSGFAAGLREHDRLGSDDLARCNGAVA